MNVESALFGGFAQGKWIDSLYPPPFNGVIADVEIWSTHRWQAMLP